MTGRGTLVTRGLGVGEGSGEGVGVTVTGAVDDGVGSPSASPHPASAATRTSEMSARRAEGLLPMTATIRHGSGRETGAAHTVDIALPRLVGDVTQA